MSTNNALQSVNNFLADDQLNKAQLLALIDLAINIKQHPNDYSQVLAGKSVAMIFEKPSAKAISLTIPMSTLLYLILVFPATIPSAVWN